jgi:hypothetical protein
VKCQTANSTAPPPRAARARRPTAAAAAGSWAAAAAAAGAPPGGALDCRATPGPLCAASLPLCPAPDVPPPVPPIKRVRHGLLSTRCHKLQGQAAPPARSQDYFKPADTWQLHRGTGDQRDRRNSAGCSRPEINCLPRVLSAERARRSPSAEGALARDQRRGVEAADAEREELTPLPSRCMVSLRASARSLLGRSFRVEGC